MQGKQLSKKKYLKTYGLSFYKSKTILDPSKLFWINQNVLEGVQKMKFISEKLFWVKSKTPILYLSEIIRTGPKEFG
mgnify:CR=1 FL=1